MERRLSRIPLFGEYAGLRTKSLAALRLWAKGGN